MNKISKIAIAIVFTLLLLSFIVFSNKKDTTTPSKKKVAVTIDILADLVKQVGADNIEVITIIPQGVDPHSYEPSVSDQLKINDSSALIYVGMGFDDWAVDLTKGNDKITLFDISKEPTLKLIDDNPHYFLSLTNGEMMARAIAKAVGTIDSENLETYINNANNLVAKIEKEREVVLNKLNQLQNKKIVTEHNAYQYLCADLGLELLAVVNKDNSNEVLPQDLAQINQLIKNNNIKSIFGEFGSASATIESIASNNNLTIYKVDAEGFGHNEYLGLMLYNVDEIIKGLD